MITNFSPEKFGLFKRLNPHALFFDCRDPRHKTARLSESTTQSHGSYNNFKDLCTCQIVKSDLSGFHHERPKSRTQMTSNGNDTGAISRGPPPK